MVSHNYPTWCVSKYTIFLDLWKTTSTSYNSCSLIFIYIILTDMWRTIKHDDSIIVVIYLIILNPGKTTLYNEYAFSSGGVNFVVIYYCVWWIITSKCDVCFEIYIYFVLFYMSWSWFNKQYTLAKIRANLIFDDCNWGTFNSFNPCPSIIRYWLILFNPCKIILSST